MRKITLSLFVVFALFATSQACAPQRAATPNPNTVNTIIAQTMAVALTQTAQPGIPVTGSGTASATFAPQVPSSTPTATLSPTPFFTATPVTPQVSVSVATNCRLGPGTAYQRVGALLVGQVAEVVGRSATGSNYWLIRNPNRPGEVCWLWGEYATVTGNTGLLPAVTPPPSPTPSPTATPSPDFAALYNGMESCTGTGWWVEIELQNNSAIPFESMVMNVLDPTTNTALPLYSDSFTNRNGCNETDTRDTLPPGSTRIVSSPIFTYDPTGHELRTTITLCSNAGQNGTCITKVINFTP